MEVHLADLSENVRYKLLTALIIPRPIAWITTMNLDDGVNAAPFSFFNVLGNDPPIVAFGPGRKTESSYKDTAENALREGEFTVGLVDKSGASQMHQTAAPFPTGMSEVSALGLETLASRRVRPPRLKLACISLECKLAHQLTLGENLVLFGTIEEMHVPDGWVEAGTYHIRPGVFEAVGRLQGPGMYCTTKDTFDLGRFPKVPEPTPNR